MSTEELKLPGDFFIEIRQDAPNKANLFYKCPCGCNGRHVMHSGESYDMIPVCNGNKIPHYWSWDGNLEAPTLAPSIWSKAENGGCGWHGFLQQGVWNSV